MKFYFEVIAPKNIHGKIKIIKPNKPFMVVPDIKKKKIVTLRTTDMLVDDRSKDTIIPITIHAYAINKDGTKSKKISVIRHSMFTFPKESVLKDAK